VQLARSAGDSGRTRAAACGKAREPAASLNESVEREQLGAGARRKAGGARRSGGTTAGGGGATGTSARGASRSGSRARTARRPSTS
jgi:hypothetical protein